MKSKPRQNNWFSSNLNVAPWKVPLIKMRFSLPQQISDKFSHLPNTGIVYADTEIVWGRQHWGILGHDPFRKENVSQAWLVDTWLRLSAYWCQWERVVFILFAAAASSERPSIGSIRLLSLVIAYNTSGRVVCTHNKRVVAWCCRCYCCCWPSRAASERVNRHTHSEQAVRLHAVATAGRLNLWCFLSAIIKRVAETTKQVKTSGRQKQ